MRGHRNRWLFVTTGLAWLLVWMAFFFFASGCEYHLGDEPCMHYGEAVQTRMADCGIKDAEHAAWLQPYEMAAARARDAYFGFARKGTGLLPEETPAETDTGAMAKAHPVPA